MAVYLHGDTHGDFHELIDFIHDYSLTENDAVIVLGDMGLYWDKFGKWAEFFIGNYEAMYKTHIYFIDGNHENFDLLKELPDEEGTPFKKCSEHIHYIPRGTVFTMGGKTILACGGADSVDKNTRTNRYDWWADEQITNDDIEKCINNSKGKDIDIIISHCCPYSIFDRYSYILITLFGIDQSKVDHTSEYQLDKLVNEVEFKKYYFGHYHVDRQLNEKYTCLLNDFIKIGE